MNLQEILLENPQNVKRLKTTLIDMTHVFSVLEMTDGEVFIETEETDTDNVVTIEVLRSRDRKEFTLVHRRRVGGDPMKSYERDYRLPIYSKVRMHVALP